MKIRAAGLLDLARIEELHRSSDTRLTEAAPPAARLWAVLSSTLSALLPLSQETLIYVAEDGGKLPLGRAYLRAVIFWGPGVIGLVPAVGSIAGLIALLGLLSTAWDQRKQGWHDKVANSVVLQY